MTAPDDPYAPLVEIGDTGVFEPRPVGEYGPEPLVYRVAAPPLPSFVAVLAPVVDGRVEWPSARVVIVPSESIHATGADRR